MAGTNGNRVKTPAQIKAGAKRRFEAAEYRLKTQEANTRKKEARFREMVANKRIENMERFLSTFAGARKDRLTFDFKSNLMTADEALIPDIETLIGRARTLRRDYWGAKSIISGFNRGVIGDGITAVSRAFDPQAETDIVTPERKTFNRTIDIWWDEWISNPEFCDHEQRRTFTQIQRLALAEALTTGDAFIRPYFDIAQIEHSVGLKIQMYDAEMLDTATFKNVENGNEIIGGVEVVKKGSAKAGVPVAYHFKRNWRDSVRIPADQIIHLATFERVMETRGETIFHPVIRKMHNLGIYDEMELEAAKINAAITGAVTSNPGSGEFTKLLEPSTGDDSLDAYGSPERTIEAGMMMDLPPGTGVEFYDVKRPSGAYESFVSIQIQEIAAAVGLDHATVLRDYTRGSYSAQRQGLIEANKEFDYWLDTMIRLVVRKIREMFKVFAILEDKVSAPGFFTDPTTRLSYLKDDIRGPKRPWIDPARQASAVEKELKAGTTSRTIIANEKGESFPDVLAELDQEDKAAAAAGLVLVGPERVETGTTNDDPGGDDA